MSEIEKNNKKKNHFIPVFYLNNFLPQERKMLYTLNIKTGKTYQAKPENIGYQNYLYSLDKEDGKNFEKDFIENVFADFEGLTVPIIQKIEDKKELPSGEDYNILMEFIALLSCRVPTMIEQASKPIKEISRNTLDIIMSDESIYNSYIERMKNEGIKLSGSKSYQEMKEFYDSGKFTIDETHNSKVKGIIKRIGYIKPFLFERNWSIILTDNTYGCFICSDNPLSLVSLDKLPAFMSPGFGMMNTEVTIPLSKHLALLGSFERQSQTGYASAHSVAALNSRTGKYADNIYFGMEDFLFIRKDGSIGKKDELIQDIKMNQKEEQ